MADSEQMEVRPLRHVAQSSIDAWLAAGRPLGLGPRRWPARPPLPQVDAQVQQEEKKGKKSGKRLRLQVETLQT